MRYHVNFKKSDGSRYFFMRCEGLEQVLELLEEIYRRGEYELQGVIPTGDRLLLITNTDIVNEWEPYKE